MHEEYLVITQVLQLVCISTDQLDLGASPPPEVSLVHHEAHQLLVEVDFFLPG